MHMSGCGRYWYDIYHNPIDDWCMDFIPARRGNVALIRRGGFVSSEQAGRAVQNMAEEWCVKTEVDCGGGA